MLRVWIEVGNGMKVFKQTRTRIVDTTFDEFIDYVKVNFPNATFDNTTNMIRVYENNKILSIYILEDDTNGPDSIINECWNYILKEEQ